MGSSPARERLGLSLVGTLFLQECWFFALFVYFWKKEKEEEAEGGEDFRLMVWWISAELPGLDSAPALSGSYCTSRASERTVLYSARATSNFGRNRHNGVPHERSHTHHQCDGRFHLVTAQITVPHKVMKNNLRFAWGPLHTVVAAQLISTDIMTTPILRIPSTWPPLGHVCPR